MEPNQINPQPAAQPMQSTPVQVPVSQPIMSPTKSAGMSHHYKWLWIVIVLFVLLLAIAFAYAKFWKVDSSASLDDTAPYASRDGGEASQTGAPQTSVEDDALYSEVDASINSNSESNLKDIDSEFNN